MKVQIYVYGLKYSKANINNIPILILLFCDLRRKHRLSIAVKISI